jgi:hypothetical protein
MIGGYIKRKCPLSGGHDRAEDNSEGERCKNEFTHFYNRAKELGLQPNPVKFYFLNTL